jgi:DNA-binding beta-propeller fold protein YncE
MAADAAGGVYVADTFNNMVQVFDRSGFHLAQWGTRGGGYGQFHEPYDVAVDGRGHVYVADTGNHRIQEFAPGY